jgi:hypothetical protein
MKVSVHQIYGSQHAGVVRVQPFSTDRFTFGHDACDVLGGQEIITGSFGNP